MSMRQIIILGLLLTFVIGVVATPAYLAAQTNAQSDKATVACPAMQKANLTDEQKAKIKAIMESAKEKARSVKEDKALPDADKKAKIHAIYQEAKNEISGLLTPDQQKKLSVLKQKFGAKQHSAVWAKNRRHLGFQKLTDDQKAWVKAILDGARKDITRVKNNASLSDEAKQQQIRSIREAAKAKIRDYLQSQGIKPGTAYRKPMVGAGHPRLAKHAAGYWTQLGLTEDQKAKIQEIRKSTHEQIKALKADTSLTPEAKKAKAHEIIQAQHSQIRGILTPEQQQKLDEMLNRSRTKTQSKNGSSK